MKHYVIRLNTGNFLMCVHGSRGLESYRTGLEGASKYPDREKAEIDARQCLGTVEPYSIVTVEQALA
jgi:hypothetical protein